MLSHEDNERLCQVGPDTPTGQALRRYWVPAFQLGDLPTNDCPPIRVRVLAEDFVAFRDTDGRYGFLDEWCCHRNASLVFGRVEDHGIRCIYHGWKYDVDGKILEMPNCDDPRFMERFSQGSYPVVAAGGLGWVYLGPKGTEPPFPAFPWTQAENVAVSEMVYDCNWVQLQEGSLDSSHVGILHLDTLAAMSAEPVPREVGSYHFSGERWDETINFPRRAGGDGLPGDNAPRIDVENTPYGFQYCATRKMDDPTKVHVRITAFGFPYTAHIAGSTGAVIVVPRDDNNSSFIGVRMLPAGSPPAQDKELPPTATTEWLSKSTNSTATPAPNGNGNGNNNVYGTGWPTTIPDGWTNNPTEGRRWNLPPQDREAMAANKSFAGFLGGNRPQDASVQGVNGPIPKFTRWRENLVPSDGAIIRFRRMIFEAARAIEEGKEPPALGKDFDFSGIGTASTVIDASTQWQDLVPGNSGEPDLTSVD
ncbi:MAG: Rieske 2Fe-2S domain-containing protein [Acidimicrobiaceae bacterium]|nr:Rieske 2Fe-2S domain-containing protein [Acidimicrobiaceae bacterium]